MRYYRRWRRGGEWYACVDGKWLRVKDVSVKLKDPDTGQEVTSLESGNTEEVTNEDLIKTLNELYGPCVPDEDWTATAVVTVVAIAAVVILKFTAPVWVPVCVGVIAAGAIGALAGTQIKRHIDRDECEDKQRGIEDQAEQAATR